MRIIKIGDDEWQIPNDTQMKLIICLFADNKYSSTVLAYQPECQLYQCCQLGLVRIQINECGN